MVLKKKIFKVRQCIFAISLLCPPRKERGPSFKQTWIPTTQWCFVPGLVEIGPVVLLKEEDFQSSSMYFRYFVIISPWKRASPFIWTIWNSHHKRMLCAKFGWNWPGGSWEEVKNRKSIPDAQTDRQNDRRTDWQTTDDRRSEKLTWAFSSGKLLLIMMSITFTCLTILNCNLYIYVVMNTCFIFSYSTLN